MHTITKLAVTLAALGFTAGAAYAQTDFVTVDTDASGELSFAELVVAWPDLTQAEFDTADVDVSGGLTADELAGLQPAASAETLPAPAAPAAPDAPAESLSNSAPAE